MKTNTEDVRSKGHRAARNFNKKNIIFPKCIWDKERREGKKKKHFLPFHPCCFVSASDLR